MAEKAKAGVNTIPDANKKKSAPAQAPEKVELNKVSIYPNITVTKQGKEAPILHVLEDIRKGTYKDIVNKVRALEYGSKPYKAMKKQAPYFTASGTFEPRNDEGLKVHSGLIAIDIDNQGEVNELKALVCCDPFVVSAFTSIGGKGLCILVKIDPDKHKKSFAALKAYYLSRYDLEADKTQDISRPRFVSYDPDIYINPDAIIFEPDQVKVKEATPAEVGQISHTWTDDEQIDFAERLTKKHHTYQVGNRHNYILQLTSFCVRLGVPQSALEAHIRHSYPDFAKDPTNAVKSGYRGWAKDFATWKNEKKYVKGKSTNKPSTPEPEPEEETTPPNEADLVRKKEFPLEVLPKAMQELITENERISGFSRDYMATSMLTAIAAVCGNAYKVQLKKDWHEPAIIWACIVGNAGVAKSPALSVGMRPIIKLEKEYHQQWIDKLKEWEKKKENLEKGETTPPKPKRKNLLISDSTMEETVIIHSDNKNGLLKRDEELIGFFKSMDAYRGGKGADAQTWLNIFDNGLVKVNRVSRDPLFLPNACISVIGGIQPKILEQMAQDGRDHNGFLARFIFAFPEHRRKEGWISESVDLELHDRYEAIIRKIYNHVQSATDVCRIPFKATSENIWAEWKLKNDQYINTTKIEANAQFYSKLEKMCARLALVLNVAYWAAGEQDNLLGISDQAMRGGIELAEYFRYNAQKANIVIKKSSDDRLEVIEQLLLRGVSKSKIADELGISRRAVYNLLNDNPWLKGIKKAKV